MRIVVWNCKMALSRKRQNLYDLRPDIAVIPECSQNCLNLCLQDDFEGRWFGDNPRKGLGVLVAKPLHIGRTKKPPSKWVVPMEISGGPHDLRLIAVWTTLVQGSLARSYIGQLCEAIADNPQWFDGKPTILAGDFNSNKIWDDMRKKTGNHSTVVSALEKHRLASAYHHFFSESQGAETQPTYYFWHHKDRPYHIDYIFLPEHWASQIQSVEVGTHAAWSKLSDHVPLSVDVTMPAY